MKVTAWNKGNHSIDGNGYGLKIKAQDRDAFFRRERGTILVELEGETSLAEINIDKNSFWDATCRELISVRIGKWLIKYNLTPWVKGKPPTMTLTLIEGRRFRLTR
jgi:hypothetical protein